MNNPPVPPCESGVPRRDFLVSLALGAGGLATAGLLPHAMAQPASTTTARPRNLLVITTHDSGRHFGCYGHPTIATPAIDSLAEEGCRLTRFFAVNPICSPSRATLFTGTYPQTHGVTTIVSREKGITMKNPEHHLATLFKQAGFQTALFGHQHEVSETSSLGFDIAPTPGPRPPADLVAREVSTFLQETTGPFFAEVNLNETHTPYSFGGATPDSSLGVDIPPFIIDNLAAHEWIAAYQGAARSADSAVGKILDALKAAGKEDDTLVVFTSDHGIELPRAKWFLYDPGIGVAMILRWPGGGIKPGRALDMLTSNVDVVPTVLELFGLPVPGHVQGKSFAAALTGDSAQPNREEIFAFQTGFQMRCVRTPRYKLIRNFELHPPCTMPGDVSKPRQDEPTSPLVELYDLESDPREFVNLADDPARAAILGDLNSRLLFWMQEQNDPILDLTPESSDFQRRAVDSLLNTQAS